MVEENILQVNYIIDGILTTIQTEVISERSDENEIQKIHYEVICEGNYIISETCSDTELSIVKLQQVLPGNTSIACYQSCRYGNFCPFGDCDNEIFCLRDMMSNDRNGICEFFSENGDLLEVKSRRLLDFCKEYKPIAYNEVYTYNDWSYRNNDL